MPKDTKAVSEFTSGLDLATQYKEIALTIPSPLTRFLINIARISKTTHLDFCQIAINNQLIHDNMEFIRKRAPLITIMKAISSVVSGDFKKAINRDEIPIDLQKSLSEIQNLLKDVDFEK